mmetsp:Transcript_91492/g.273009  ORF Transcript_91492/g.273009 Transcript_91492/m.273009 type:complete len:224 (-) Transcript_91492:2077-2748(-)
MRAACAVGSQHSGRSRRPAVLPHLRHHVPRHEGVYGALGAGAEEGGRSCLLLTPCPRHRGPHQKLDVGTSRGPVELPSSQLPLLRNVPECDSRGTTGICAPQDGPSLEVCEEATGSAKTATAGACEHAEPQALAASPEVPEPQLSSVVQGHGQMLVPVQRASDGRPAELPIHDRLAAAAIPCHQLAIVSACQYEVAARRNASDGLLDIVKSCIALQGGRCHYP